MDLTDLGGDWSLGNAELLQQIATLVWLHKGDTEMLKEVAEARVVYELYQRLSGEREVEALRTQTIMAIVKYVKDHPKATKEELTKEIGKQIWLFSQKIDKL